MTVRLLVDFKDPADGKQYVVGNLYTSAANEAGLIATKQATSDLTGGTAWVDPVVPESIDETKGVNVVLNANGEVSLQIGSISIGTDKSFDQYGRPQSNGVPYEIPGFSGTPIDLSAATFTNTAGASTLKSGIPGVGSGLGVKLTNSGNATSDIVLGAKVPMSDVLMFTLNVYRAPANSTPALLKIYLLDTAGNFSNYWYATATITASGEQTIAIPRGAFTVTGTPTEATGFAQIRYRIDNETVSQCPPLPAGESVLIGALRKNPRTRAKVMFTHDDGKSLLYNYYTNLKAYGFAGCAYIVPSIVGKPGYVTLAQLKQMQADGWVIANHSMTHPADAAQSGIELLGPVGIGISVSGVNTTTGVITAATNRAPVGYAAPISFGGTALPTGITAGTRYYPKNVDASNFTIHPTLDDSIAGTNKIIPSSAGTSVTFSYSDATADESGIKVDFQAAADWLTANGFEPWHIALPQASHDYTVCLALDSLPTETVRGVYDEYKNSAQMSSAPTFYTYPNSTLATDKSTTPPGPWMNLPAATDTTLGLTASVKTFLDGLVSTGATGCCMEHGNTDANVIALCDYVQMLVEADLADVTNPVDWKSGYQNRL